MIRGDNIAPGTGERIPTLQIRTASNPWLDALRRLMRNKAAVASAIFLILLVTVALLADVIAPYDPTVADFTRIRTTPSAEHLLGTY